jgi:hypothetical protein
MSRFNELIEKLRTLEEGNLQNRQKRLLQVLQVSPPRNAKSFVADFGTPDGVVEREGGPSLNPVAQPSVAGKSPIPGSEKLLQSLGKGTCKTSRSDPEAGAPTRCGHCGGGERSGAMIVPFGTEVIGHTWLHSECWPAWYARRHPERSDKDDDDS